MKTHLLLILSFLYLPLFAQSRLSINIPTVESESRYVLNTIQDINFFEEHNYQISLPQGNLIERLKQKARTERLTEEDYTKLLTFMRNSIYRQEDYQAGYEKIHKASDLIDRMITDIETNKFTWDYKSFQTYNINLTLYGPGGSYNPDDGSILIYTSPQGQFKGYEDPANTIIHEIFHIGIEKSIIIAYNVPHPMKERIVDRFIFMNFAKYLPKYRIQDMGDIRADEYLKTPEDFARLEEIVRGMVKD